MKRTVAPPKTFRILANDPSLTAWGWVVVENDRIIDCGCIKTEPNTNKTRIRKGDDRVRRVSEINKALLTVITKYKVSYMASELPHGSQSAVSAVMIGITAGIMQTFSDILGIGLEWYSEQDAKKSVVNKKSATKDEIKQAINKLYKVPWTGIGYRDESIADALAVYHVMQGQSATVQFFKSNQ